MRTTKEIINAMIVELAGNGILLKGLKVDYRENCINVDSVNDTAHTVVNIDVTAGILGENDTVKGVDYE